VRRRIRLFILTRPLYDCDLTLPRALINE